MIKRLVILFILLISVGWYSYHSLMYWAETPTGGSTSVVYTLERGTKLDSLAGALESQGAISSSLKFSLLVRLKGSYQSFRAGIYRFTPEDAPLDIVGKMVRGQTYEPVILRLTFPEGFTFKKILSRLEAAGVRGIDEGRGLFHDQEFLKSLSVPGPTLEGYLYPATYDYTRIPTAKDALTRMVKTFWEKLPGSYQKSVEAKGLTLHQAVTFGSLIEMETRLDHERPMVAEVIWNRLQRGEPLAIDASLIYGIRDYDGDIKWRHLKDRKNRYNSRLHKGLPPTPIGSPALESLKAVLSPTNKGYYYYVLKVDGDGEHHFSKTLSEHNKHVRNLVSASSRKRRETVSEPTGDHDGPESKSDKKIKGEIKDHESR